MDTKKNTGRYYVRDIKSGRTFCVEPIAERDQKIDDRAFTNGGTDGTAVKNKSSISGGAIHREDSEITEDNGFKNIIETGPGVSPDDVINKLLNQ